MRNARKLMLFAVMALAAMALAAPAAFGQAEGIETIEITNETGANAHCPVLTPTGGGCLIHATSEGPVELRKHVFGIESHITSCENEFWGRVNEDGEGRITHQQLTDPSCQRQPCKVSGVSTPWPAHGDEGEGPAPIEGTEKLTTVFCVEPLGGGTDESCEIEVPFGTEDNTLPADHEYEFGHSLEIPGHGVGGFRCELVGHWHTEVGPAGAQMREENQLSGEEEVAIEVTHHND